MIAILISWCYIATVSIVVGIAFGKLWYRITGYSIDSMEMYIITGLVIITIYAQIFSLFAGIGFLANLLLLLVCAGLLFYIREDVIHYFKKSEWYKKRYCILLIVMVAVFVSVFTAQVPTHYDTYLYHAQAIRWIEEFGVVPGLGNLHSRFAYNSAFLVLQALFSFAFLGSMSFHTLNGFICVLFISYALLTMKLFKRQGLMISDGFRSGLLIFILHGSGYISSPNTDQFALILTSYILIKWCGFEEENEKTLEPYCWLCLLGIYACTLKLSALFILILLFKPLWCILGKKQWGRLGFYIVCSILIVMPFIIRNVIISGYILYPYWELDIVPFIDWKMDPNIIKIDRRNIVIWGRCINEIENAEGMSVIQWLPIWLKNNSPFSRIMFIVSAFLSVGQLITIIYCWVKRENGIIMLSVTTVICFWGWFFTAPLVRYGEIYMWMLCGLFLSYWSQEIRGMKNAGLIGILSLLCIAMLYAGKKGVEYTREVKLFMPYDYEDRECLSKVWEGITIYLPVEGDQTGYHKFPMLPYLDERLKLRGKTLRGGIRLEE